MRSSDHDRGVRRSPAGVCVLGMHRSGTSAATRLVNLLGLSTCAEEDLLHDPRGNAKGHWESVSMVAINERLLAEMGRSWWCPPRAGPGYELDAARISSDPSEVRKAFDAVHPQAPWVWKDPRTSLTLPFWSEALDRPVAALVVVRNPLEVATSLLKRDRLSVAHGVALWERYNRLTLSHVQGMPVHLSRYDDLVADPVRWCEGLAGFFESCGLSWSGVIDGDRIRAFVDGALRHSRLGWLDVLSEFASSAAVLDAVESSIGTWRSFESPELAAEAPWVEAEFVAIGSWQPSPLPEPPETTVTVVVANLGAPPKDEVDHLSRQLLPFAEGIVVTDAAPESGEIEPADRVRVVRVAPGTPLGAARMAGAEQATTDLIDFRAPGATLSNRWLPDMRRAFAAGYAAVTPGVAGPAGGGGYGLGWSDGVLNSRWRPRPADVVETVPLVAGACFAVQRAALHAVGGFDPELGAYGLDVHELSMRLWRLGRRCAVARDAVATVPEPALYLADPDSVDWESYMHDLVRLGTVHLDLEDLGALTAGVRDRPGTGHAIARVLVSDATSRRAALEAQHPLSSRAFLDWCGVRRPAGGSSPDSLTAGNTSPAGATAGASAQHPVSLIVSSPGGPADEAPAPLLGLLRGELPPGTEVIVTNDRCAAAARATGSLLLFLDASAEPVGGWAAPLLAAAAEQPTGAAGAAVLSYGRRRQPVGGLTFSPRFGDFRRKLIGPDAHPDRVPALTRSCLAIRRELYLDIGGLDAELEAGGWADAELCLRLWRAGHPCLVIPSSVVAVSRPWWGAGPPCFDDVLYGALRVAALHLDGPDHKSVLERFRHWRGFAPAIARVAGSDAGRRRARIAARSETSAGAVLRHLAGDDLFD
jgi:GT2 family glycosyltransferase